jgi:integrase
LELKSDLHAGRTPRAATAELTVFSLCGLFLTAKQRKLEAGELTHKTFRDYTSVCQIAIKAFGRNRLVSDLRPDDFGKLRAQMALRLGPERLTIDITRVRSVFRFAAVNGLIDRAVVYGDAFAVPSQRQRRLHRAAQGPKMFEAGEVRRMLDAAGQPLKTMILLAVNCGFGNSDCGTLPLSALDLDGGWVNYHRPKTGINRRCPLWSETIAAVRDWLAVRPEPRGRNAGLLFVTIFGTAWHKTETKGSPITGAFAALRDKLGLGRSFYALRHTFQTIGDESGDFVAVRCIMGHAGGGDIADAYRERISDERLRKVTDHVRKWLFSPAAPAVES